MKIYELINPSDPYTFLAESHEVAALTVFLLSTAYGAESEDKNCDVPVFLFGGSREWYMEKFKRTPDEGLSCLKEEVGNALLSFVFGGFLDRRRYEAALSAITDESRKEEFINAWNNDRTSMNDIGTYAHETGRRLLSDK